MAVNPKLIIFGAVYVLSSGIKVGCEYIIGSGVQAAVTEVIKQKLKKE